MNNDKKLGLYDVIVQKRELDSVEMDGDIVMMDIEKGKYYGFNSVGSRIWQLAENPLTPKQVMERLMQEFDVDVKTCEEAVMEFLNGLFYEELISIM